MTTATAIATPTTEELNGMLQQQTPSLISLNVVAQQLGAEAGTVLTYCQAKSVFVAPLYDGGEYMVDFNSITEAFIRDFTMASLVQTLEPQIQQRVQAIASLRGGQQSGAVASSTTKSETEASTEATEGETRGKWQSWRIAKKGGDMRGTVVNLVNRNDADGTRGFLQALAQPDEKVTALIERVIKTHYNGSTRSKNSFLKEIKAYLTEMGVAQPEQKAKRSRSRKAEGAEQAS